MKLAQVARRFLPGFLVQWIYFVRFRAMVSPRAEVEVSGHARFGRGTVISSFTKIKISGPFVTGRRVQIASNCFIEVGAGGLTIGDDVLVGPLCGIVTTNYRYERLGVPMFEQGTTSHGVTIGDRAWIGAGVTILDGATIGPDAIITAGSVVTHDVPAGAIVQGSPAQVVFRRR